nr:unnamed protein product [Callosobruchus analis]
MIRASFGLQTLATEITPDFGLSYKSCQIHQEQSLNSRLFTLLCEYLDSDHKLLLFHTNVRWLSKANMFSRLHELKEVIIFLEFKEKHDFLTMFKDDIFQWNLFN